MSQLRAGSISDVAGTGPVTLTGQEGVKARVAYNQVVPEIDESYNISSTTDAAAGFFDHSFTNNMATARYSFSGGTDNTTSTNIIYMSSNTSSGPITTSLLTLFSAQVQTGSVFDTDFTTVMVVGDLA